MPQRSTCLAPDGCRRYLHPAYGRAVAVMPMFPLGTVLLPGSVLPLHVFEPRYRQLVIDCLADDTGDPEFGVALIERGWEVGGGDERTNVAVVARIVRVEALDGGRYALVTVGTRRVRVNAWLPDDPYPLADVDDWPDEDPDAVGLADRAAELTARLRGVLALAVELGELRSDAVDLSSIDDDPLLASYHLAALAPIGPADRYRLLCAPSPAARLELLAGALDDVEAMLRFRLSSAGPD
jgi:Lon protease-like protein